jgi:hypothetical protein
VARAADHERVDVATARAQQRNRVQEAVLPLPGHEPAGEAGDRAVRRDVQRLTEPGELGVIRGIRRRDSVVGQDDPAPRTQRLLRGDHGLRRGEHRARRNRGGNALEQLAGRCVVLPPRDPFDGHPGQPRGGRQVHVRPR